MSKSRLLLLLGLLLIVGLFFALGGSDYLSLANLQAQRAELVSAWQAHPWQGVGLYALIYVLVTGLSLPGAAVMTLAGGAVFGFWVGLLVVSFASTIGATLAFWVGRYLLRDWVATRFPKPLAAINRGIERDGAFYLFGLRLVPLFPFFVINLLTGLTRMRSWTFYWVSQLGMLAATAVFVNAGTQLAGVQQISDVLSFDLLLALSLLGLLPLTAPHVLRWLRRRRAYRDFERPESFDYNLLVIGGGAAGLVAANVAATLKARVALVERSRMGGDCLNTGCVPSKALLRAASVAHTVRRAGEFGIQAGTPQVDFGQVMRTVAEAVGRVEPHDSVERYQSLGVDCIAGEARLLDPWRVQVGEQTMTARHIVLATGARPFVPPVPGLSDIDYLTSDNLWQLDTLPPRLAVLGGGAIGCEMAQAFARLGSAVTLVEMADQLLPAEDGAVGELLAESFERDGVQLELGRRVEQVDGNALLLDDGRRIEFDRLLVAVGRQPVTDGLGLDTLGIDTDQRGFVQVDDYLQTALPNIYACGDVVGPYQLTHAAGHQGWHVAVNALLGRFKRFRVDYSAMPLAVYSDPEVARVGLNQKQAEQQRQRVEVTRFDLAELDRAIADRDNRGFAQVLTAPGSDRVLGATVVGPHAAELIHEFVLARRHGLGLNKLLAVIRAYPSYAETGRFAAAEWKKAHAPHWALRLLARYHRRQRGSQPVSS